MQPSSLIQMSWLARCYCRRTSMFLKAIVVFGDHVCSASWPLEYLYESSTNSTTVLPSMLTAMRLATADTSRRNHVSSRITFCRHSRPHRWILCTPKARRRIHFLRSALRTLRMVRALASSEVEPPVSLPVDSDISPQMEVGERIGEEQMATAPAADYGTVENRPTARVSGRVPAIQCFSVEDADEALFCLILGRLLGSCGRLTLRVRKNLILPTADFNARNGPLSPPAPS